MGRYLLAEEELPFLKIGLTFAIFQESGIAPDSKIDENTRDSGNAKNAAIVTNKMEWKPAGPGVDLPSKFLNTLYMSAG